MKNQYRVAIVAPVPFYYHIPLYRALEENNSIKLTLLYCSDETLKGEDVKKMYNSKGSMIDNDFLLSGYSYKFLKNYSLKPSYMKWPFGLVNFGIWKEIKNGKYDAVVLQAWTNITWIIAFLACLRYKTPVMFMTDSNVAAEHGKNPLKKIAKRILLEKLLFKFASGFLASGTANKKFYQYYNVPENKIKIFPFSWGYDDLVSESKKLIPQRGELRKSLNIKDDDFAIIYVGRLSVEKSLETLLEAFKNIKNENKKLFLIGDGPLRSEIEEKIKEMDIKNIELLGFKKREEIFQFYVSCDVLVLPSCQETWGMVVNEAMCFGLPIVASDQVGSAVDLVKDGKNGFIFKNKDFLMLQESLEKIMNLNENQKENFKYSSLKIINNWINKSDPVNQIISLLHLSDNHRISGIIRKVSYNPFLIKLVRFLGLRSFLRKVYFWFASPKNGILKFVVNNLEVSIYVKNPGELRLAESIVGESGEKQVLEELINSVNQKDIVFDIGANIGIYSVLLSKKVGIEGRIFAFEPEKNSHERLLQNIKLNNSENITVIQKALGKESDFADLYVGETTGNFSLIKSYEKEVNSQRIQIVNGDEFIEKENLPIPKAIKIDVEGYEYSVLKGLEETLQNPLCRIICCELHPGLFPDGVDENIIINFIKEFGFKNIKTFKRAFSAYHVIAKKD